MDVDLSEVDPVLARLKPFFDTARAAGGDVLHEVGGALTEKAAGGVTSIGIRTAGAVHRAIRNRIGRSRARHRFEKELAEASDEGGREAACRKLLAADPFLRDSLASLLERRDYLRALVAYCDELPVIDLMPGGHRLSEVFVQPELISSRDNTLAQSPVTSNRLLDSGHHFVEGDAGSGKSMLSRWLAGRMAQHLLADDSAPALDRVRLPILIAAAELCNRSWAQALRDACDAQLGLREISPLSAEFFDPRATHGHRQWTVIIDGLDEVDDPQRRQAIWRAITAVHAGEIEAFRFIIFARPDTQLQVPETFERWRIASPSTPGILVARYARSDAQRAALTQLLEQRDYREVARIPLFVAMAAALFEQFDALPTRPHELIEAFVGRGLDRASGGEPTRRSALSRLLACLAEGDADTARALLDVESDAAALLAPAFSRIERAGQLERHLVETGLVRRNSSGRLDFLHRLIARYFLADTLASRNLPSPRIWREIDPARLGWAGVGQLCTRWSEQGHAIEDAIAALAEHGDEARDTMLRLAVHLPNVEEHAFGRAFGRLERELDAGELTSAHEMLLPGLVSARIGLRQQLVSIAQRDTYGFALLPIAEACAKAGHFRMVRSSVLRIASDAECESNFRMQAASLLLDQDDRITKALEVLHEIAREGDEGWVRFEAAHRLHAKLGDATTLELLREVAHEVYVEGDERLHAAHLELLLEMGEFDLALPLIREAANPSEDTVWIGAGDAVEAAALLAHHDAEAGHAALERILAQPTRGLRDCAEVLLQLDRLDPAGGHRDRLVAQAQRLPQEVDWRVVDILVEWDRADAAWEVVRAASRKAFQTRFQSYSFREALSHVLPMVEEEAGASLIREGLLHRPDDPDLVRLLALVGKSAEARTRLVDMLDPGNPHLARRAARTLARIGEHDRAVTCLSAISMAAAACPQSRLDAIQELLELEEAAEARCALRAMVADRVLAFEYRAEAATRLSATLDEEDEEVFEALGRVARGHGPVGDRLKAMATIADLDPWRDYYYLYCPSLKHMVGLKGFSSANLKEFARLCRELECELGDFPRALDLLRNGDLCLPERLDIIEYCSQAGANPPWTVELLSEIAFDEGATLASRIQAIKLLGSGGSAKVERLLDRLAANTRLPPAWRLKFATATGEGPGRDRLATLAVDPSIAVAIRLEADSSLVRGGASTAFPDFGAIHDLDVGERVAIARAAKRRGLGDRAREALEACLELPPLSLYELVEIHHAAESGALDDIAEQARVRLCEIPFAIAERNEDIEIVIDAVAIIAGTDDAAAIDLLSRLLRSDEVSIWSFARILEAMLLRLPRDEVLACARPVLDKAVAALGQPEEFPGMAFHALEPLFLAGWIDDPAPLVAVAADPARTLSARIEAAVLTVRCFGAHSAALHSLSSLVETAVSDVADAALAARSLVHHGYEVYARRLLDTCLAVKDLDAQQIVQLAVALGEVGRRAEAGELVRGIVLEDLGSAFLLDGDFELLREQFGTLAIETFRNERLEASGNTLDRLIAARDRVIEDGCPISLDTIRSMALDPEAHPADRLEAVDALDELGFRKLARETFDTIELSGAEPLWVARQAARFGRKAQARDYYLRALKVETANLDLVHAGLADLNIEIEE